MTADKSQTLFPDNRYITERHSYWIETIGRAGIWNPSNFSEVSLYVRPRSKTRGGTFSRRTVVGGGRAVFEDRIFIYRNSSDMTAGEVDNVLVHEMIHQYIVQTGITDSSAHGCVFRSLAARINAAFPDSLKVTVSTRRRSATGPGEKLYLLLVLQSGDNIYCCVVCRTRVDWFKNFIYRNHIAMKVDKMGWCQTDDRHFENFRQCRTSIHGEKIPFQEFDAYCRKYRLRKI